MALLGARQCKQVSRVRGRRFSLFGSLRSGIARSAEKHREKNPGKPVMISWVSHSWLRVLRYMDDYDPAFGQAFYNGTWMKGVDQEGMLRDIRCP